MVIGAAFTGGIPEFNGWLAEHGVAGGKVALAPELGPGLRGMVASTDVQFAGAGYTSILPPQLSTILD